MSLIGGVGWVKTLIVTMHTEPNWCPGCFNSKFINKSNFTHPNAQELSVNFDQSYGTCWQFLRDASNFIAIYKGFHFGMEQLLAHCAMSLFLLFFLLNSSLRHCQQSQQSSATYVTVWQGSCMALLLQIELRKNSVQLFCLKYYNFLTKCNKQSTKI